MNVEAGHIDLVVFVDLMKKYCSLGPRERVYFSKLVAGDDLSSEGVAAITLGKFTDILTDAVIYLEDSIYAEGLLIEINFLLGKHEPALEEKDYY